MAKNNLIIRNGEIVTRRLRTQNSDNCDTAAPSPTDMDSSYDVLY